ncbi:MAG: Do family serine endopeptidase [Bacteroidota bacterium]|nr:Do family serine endopeptidase [Bacteroidota bacterium]MDP4274150.1 Do family serine endopeptidase [Bacteroidota bacterium]
MKKSNLRRTFLTVLFCGLIITSVSAKAIQNSRIQSSVSRGQERLYGPAEKFQNDPVDFTYAAEKTVHAVVHVKTKSLGSAKNMIDSDNPFYDFFFGDRNITPQPVLGFGSGVIISADGYIITNNHVIDKADSIQVVLNDKREYTAKVIGTDPSTDIALLKIDEKDLPFITYGNSDDLKIGEWVLAVGNPYNLTSTVTAGIVSAKGRNINLLGENSKSPIESFIQTDAAVNPGNSGGALVNTKGELVGINTAIATPTGAYSGNSFAVPVNIAKKVVADLMKYGEVQRAVLGVIIQDVDASLAKSKKIDKIEGVYIAKVVEKGSAAAAGIKEGDVVVKVNDNEINNTASLQEEINKFHPNDKVMVTVMRDNKMKQFEVTLRNMQGRTKMISKEALVGTLGASFEEISAEEKKDLKISHGVKVIELQNGKLKKAGVEEGFIIMEINNKPVVSVDDIRSVIAKTKGGVFIQGIYPDGNVAYYAFGM